MINWLFSLSTAQILDGNVRGGRDILVQDLRQCVSGVGLG